MADADSPKKEKTKKGLKSVRLQVAAARQEESGQGIARIPRSAFQELVICSSERVRLPLA